MTTSADVTENSCRPVCLIIMDGLAYGTQGCSHEGNAVEVASTPHLDDLFAKWPHSFLEASGLAVGLPEGQMGNSEVGHLNIGAGRIVYQELSRIDRAIESGEIRSNSVIMGLFEELAKSGKTLHLMGLLSDGGVHSSNKHLYALIALAQETGVSNIALHLFMDGRDTPPTSGKGYVEELIKECKTLGAGEIQTIVGRYYAMDRDKRFDRVQKAYDALTLGTGKSADDPLRAVQESYDGGVTDEFVEPIVFGDNLVKEDDGVIFFNFRPDRARELTRAFTDDAFDGFERTTYPKTHFVCLTEYDPTIKADVAFPKETLTNVLADVLEEAGLKQLHIAETEKYAHVTFFFNGGVEEPKEHETRILIPSPKVATYDFMPEMSAPKVGDALVDAIKSHAADVYICNFANGDMVGHTGSFKATVKAVTTVDAQVGRVVEAMNEVDGVTLITADHGNAEQMCATDGETPFTAHTCNRVPFIAINSGGSVIDDGALCDIAPTMLALLKIVPPEEWTGKNLVVY